MIQLEWFRDKQMWWIGFNLFVLAMLALDLGVFHRKAHEVKFKEAIAWSIVWIGLALCFNLGIWMGWVGGYAEADRGRVAIEFFTGYLVEKSLSVDNVFVFAMVFTYFAVPAAYQHRVLFCSRSRVHGPEGRIDGVGWPWKYALMVCRRYSNTERPC